MGYGVTIRYPICPGEKRTSTLKRGSGFGRHMNPYSNRLNLYLKVARNMLVSQNVRVSVRM